MAPTRAEDLFRYVLHARRFFNGVLGHCPPNLLAHNVQDATHAEIQRLIDASLQCGHALVGICAIVAFGLARTPSQLVAPAS